MNPKFGKEAQLFYMDTGSFIVSMKTADIHANIEKDVEAKFDTWNSELDRLLLKEKKLDLKVCHKIIWKCVIKKLKFEDQKQSLFILN